MTVPAGDLPDWSVLTAPLVQSAAQLASGATSGLVIVSESLPIRLWGLWMSMSLVSTAAYAGGTEQIDAYITDGAANVLLALTLALTGPSQFVADSVALGVEGLTPAVHLGNYAAELNVVVPNANSFVRCSAGVYWSLP